MKTNESSNACPKCGAPVPPEAPQGLCPQCVFAQAAAPEAAPTATSQIPSLERLAVAFPQLQILELIGRGGMGFVFKARQPHLDRFVALKLLPDSLAHDAHFAERFNREGRTLARLNHPNIVSIFDFGQAGGFYFLLMEYVDGVNLRQAMQAGRFSPSEALAIVPKICEALQFAHEEGVLHRDIKPENILLDAKGRVKIADFGIAKIVGEDKPDLSLTATGAALGTPHYMAPEQFEKPGTVDHRADIYSLGVVFYEMLTGELPIGRFSPPSQRTPVDPRVDDVVMRTLEKEREKRFQSAGEMKTNVEHLTESGAGSFKGKSVPPKAAAGESGPRGTMVINPSAVTPAVPAWSLKTIWGAVLVGITSLPMIVLLVFIAYFAEPHGPLGGWEIILILASVILSLPAIIGTILGWMGLNDIRAQAGQRRGLPLAVFAALAWPDLILLIIGLVLPLKIMAHMDGNGVRIFSAILMLPVAVGTITFVIWTVYATVRWGANQPAPERRGKLKWIFAMLMLAGLGFIALSTLVQVQRNRALERAVAVAVKPIAAPTKAAEATPWIRFTFTAVELREVKGVRWLAIDYLDDVHGECQKSFPWETTIPGFKAETRTTEFITDAKGGSPSVRHQRIEYRMPDSSPRDQLERLRDDLEKTLKQKSFRLELGENEVPLTLFELPGVEGGSLKARIKVMPPLRQSPPMAASNGSLVGTNRASGSIALTIKRAEIEPQSRKLQVFFDLDESPGLDIEADTDTAVIKSGAQFPAPMPGAVSRIQGRSHVAEWVLPAVFDVASLTNAQWQVNNNMAGQRFVKGSGQVVTLAVLGNGTGYKVDEWQYEILLKAVELPGSSKPGEQNSSPSFSFGPTAMRTLSFDEDLKDAFLDLDTGRLLTPPKEIAALFKTPYLTRVEWERKSDPRATKMREWLQTSGANLMASGGEYPERLEVREVSAVAPTVISNQVVIPFGFDQADASYLVRRISRSLESLEKQEKATKTIRLLQPGFNGGLNMREDSFCFRTRDGTLGILQILNVENNPRRLRIRYKLVEALKTNSATARKFQFRLVADGADTGEPVDRMTELRSNGTSNSLRVLQTVLLDGSTVARAGIVLETNGDRTIGIELTAEGARQLGAITAANIGRQFAIIADGQVLSAPIIRSAVSGGELQISGNMSAAEIHQLVATLNRTNAQLHFAEPIERSVPIHLLESKNPSVGLDLESGRFFTNVIDHNWITANGIDLAALRATNGSALLNGFDMLEVLAPASAWDTLSAEDVAWNWSLLRVKAASDSYPYAGSRLPEAFLFRTREGSFGVLQILAAEDGASHVKIRYKLVQAASMEKSKSPGAPYKLQLLIPTIENDPYRSVSVATDSELPTGVYPVVLLQRPDGRIEEHPPVTTINTGSGRTRVVRHLLWSLSLIESNQVREIATAMRATMDKRVVELKVDGRSPVFQATNDQGATTDGFIALRSQEFSATNPPAVTVSIVDGAPQNWSSFLSVKLRISAPSGYLPNAIGLRGDGSQLATHTWISGDGSGDFCYWYLPQEFQASDIQEIVRQLESTKVTSPSGIKLLPGQRVPMFSVTNGAGAIFRGYFELPMIAGTK